MHKEIIYEVIAQSSVAKLVEMDFRSCFMRVRSLRPAMLATKRTYCLPLAQTLSC